MADVCDALSETAQLLHALAGQRDGLTMLRLSSPAAPHEDDIKFCGVHELEFKLTGAAMEIKRLRVELDRLDALRGLA